MFSLNYPKVNMWREQFLNTIYIERAINKKKNILQKKYFMVKYYQYSNYIEWRQ